MKDVNKYIKRTRHTIPTQRELETRLNGAKFFSHLDMNDGYMQLELAEESRKLTTFYTHRGLKRFRRLHFGVNSEAETSVRRSTESYPWNLVPSASTMTSWSLVPHRRNMTRH